MKVSVVVLAYGAEPQLAECVAALRGSTNVDVEIVLVDNGCSERATVDALAGSGEVALVRPRTNLGFAGGCNVGARHASGEVLAFVNSDAVVSPDAVHRLAEACTAPDVGIATASVRLADQPALLNTAGNPWHIAGVVWSGHFGEAAAAHASSEDVATASGAAFAMRRDVWDLLGGFDDVWFAYNEDAELSMRAWQRGLRVVYVPDAVVLHHYEFSRNHRKAYLVERNRLLNLLTLYQLRTLLLLSPVLLVFELGVLVMATAQGWLPEKLKGYGWILRNAHWLAARRRAVQSSRLVDDRALAHLFTSRFDPANITAPAGAALVNVFFDVYWRAVRRFV